MDQIPAIQSAHPVTHAFQETADAIMIVANHHFLHGPGHPLRSSSKFQGLCQQMRVVCIQEDGQVEFLAKTPHTSREQPRSRKLPFSLRSANHNRHFSSRASKTPFSRTRSAMLKCPTATPFLPASCTTSMSLFIACCPDNHVQARRHHLASSGLVPSGRRCSACRCGDAASRNTDLCLHGPEEKPQPPPACPGAAR